MVGPVDEALLLVDEMRKRRVSSFVFEKGFLKVEFLPPEPPKPAAERERRPLVADERDELDTLRQRLRREEEALSAS